MSKAHELVHLAVDVSKQAGELLLDRFGGPARGVAAKSTPTDLVSDADRMAEEVIVAGIAAARPDDGIVSEEGGGHSAGELTWVIDPLDGTINFLFGIPQWAVTIAIDDAEGTLVGVTHDPLRSETFTAIRGQGAQLNGEPISVTDQDDLSQALIGTGFAYDQRARAYQAEILQRVLPRARDIRRAGSAALDLAALACGRLDGFYEAPMERWDKAAGILLIREAGGVVSELEAPFELSPGVIAAGPRLHDELRALVLA
ncbi:MAG TPA: inositol monophosphatase family protein [Actinomycetota bacterium]|nr:inositol monophosphatase family protein [Actinomycetota bacterium]